MSRNITDDAAIYSAKIEQKITKVLTVRHRHHREAWRSPPNNWPFSTNSQINSK